MYYHYQDCAEKCWNVQINSGSRDSLLVERRSHDGKVVSSSPDKSVADWHPVSVPPRVTAVARKRARPFCHVVMLTVLQVITPSRNLVLCAESRREMEEWINALKMAASKEYYEVSFSSSVFSYDLLCIGAFLSPPSPLLSLIHI